MARGGGRGQGVQNRVFKSTQFIYAPLAHFAGECQLTESLKRLTPEPRFTLFRHTIKQADKEHEFISFKFIQRQKKTSVLINRMSQRKKQEEELQKQHRLHADLEIE